MRIKFPKNQGFTLLELLVVITLLAILASVALMSNDGTREQAEVDTTKYEMAELRKALLQFRRDTGDFPGQGIIYGCTDPANALAANPDLFFPAYAPASSDAAGRITWCNSPANFWMLFLNPLDDPTTTAIEEGGWNPDTKRGWHGPYLSRSGSRYVDVGSIDVATPQSELPTVISNALGVADAFFQNAAVNDIFWRVSHDALNDASGGRPYLLFLHPTESDQAKIVSMAENRTYDGHINDTDQFCNPKLDATTSKALDIVVCMK